MSETWLTKDMLRAWAAEQRVPEPAITRLWMTIAKIDTKLKKSGKPGFTVQVNMPPYELLVDKSNLTRTERQAGARVALSTVKSAWHQHQITVRMVSQYGHATHDLLRRWLESFN